jgi:ketoreductase RED2
MEAVVDKRVVIVTGSTSGIGRGVAELLLSRGWRVVINSRSDDEVGESMAALSDHLIYAHGDISNAQDCAQVVKAAITTWGRVDGLVNNAGTTAYVEFDDIEGVTADIWHRVLDVNVIGTWQMISAAMPHLKAAAPGRIVNIASVAGLRPVGSSVPYSVSKVAIVHMTSILGKVLGPDVLVNAVAPGLVETAWTQDWSDVKENVAAAAPLRRVGHPEDIAVACEYLLNTTYTTGECIAVDGGMRLVV